MKKYAFVIDTLPSGNLTLAFAFVLVGIILLLAVQNNSCHIQELSESKLLIIVNKMYTFRCKRVL